MASSTSYDWNYADGELQYQPEAEEGTDVYYGNTAPEEGDWYVADTYEYEQRNGKDGGISTETTNVWKPMPAPAAPQTLETQEVDDDEPAEVLATPEFLDDQAYLAAVDSRERSQEYLNQTTPLLDLSSGGISAGADYGNQAALSTDASVQASNDRTKVEAMEIGGVADANYAQAQYAPSPVYDPYVDYKKYSEDLA
jgi:hypothetical protein